MHDIVEVRFGDHYELAVVFDNGRAGVFDMAELIGRGGVFEALRDPAVFRSGFVNPDVGTVCWPNGADVCPDVLYSAVTGEPLPGRSGTRVVS